MTVPVRLAITMGDPAGIGPEIVLKALQGISGRGDAGQFAFVVSGVESCIADAASRLGMDVRCVRTPDAAHWPTVAVAQATELAAPVPLAEVSAEGGRLAYHAVAKAVELAVAHEVDAIVTAPLNKAALHMAGYKYPGHTELLAELTGTRGTVLMLAHGDFRVSHVTTHVALEKVPSLVTRERLHRVIDLTLDAMRRLGIGNPRIGVAGLNPHAGEGGIFGRQEIETIEPVLAEYRAKGLAVDGPVPGDVVFVKLRGGHYDAVVAMYHDQGHVPTKLLGFGIDRATGSFQALSGVNITLGLPIIRTSVDHGTAFDIAGKGIADATSMIEAIDYAAALVRGGRAAGDHG
jgi:4-hydroxythreonine-4-phosphate dehydrogenase